MDYIQHAFTWPFTTGVLVAPDVVVRLPTSIPRLPPILVLIGVLAMYAIITSGIVYDMIVEPPRIGTYQDETGAVRLMTVMRHRLNGQFQIEGFCAGLMFILAALGFMLVDIAASSKVAEKTRINLLGVGCVLIVIGYNVLVTFLRIKVPGYMT